MADLQAGPVVWLPVAAPVGAVAAGSRAADDAVVRVATRFRPPFGQSQQQQQEDQFEFAARQVPNQTPQPRPQRRRQTPAAAAPRW